MDYEKRFNEALERAKELLLGNEHSNTIRSYFEHIFPELRESEDERIRRDIVAVVEMNEDLTQGRKAEIYAYLENQKEKEQKPAEKQDYSGLNDSERAIHRGFLIAGVDNVSVGIIKDTAKECIANFPWPTKWSKEDENTINEICNIIVSNSKNGYLGGYFAGDLVQKLKSLRPQQKAEWSEDIIQKAVKEVGLTQHQIDWFKTNVFPPKQEWSEEDERIMNGIQLVLESWDRSHVSSAGLPSLVPKYISWLESRRPGWKPSKEQMEVLERASTNEYLSAKQFDILVSLYEKLKKL